MREEMEAGTKADARVNEGVERKSHSTSLSVEAGAKADEGIQSKIDSTHLDERAGAGIERKSHSTHLDKEATVSIESRIDSTHLDEKPSTKRPLKPITPLETKILELGICGYLKKGQGTLGSLEALIVAAPILYYLPYTLFLLGVVLTIYAIPLIDRYEATYHTHDSGSITIDEAAGIFISVGMLPHFSYMGLGLCFVTFRILDITKPSIIGRIDRQMKGGAGVMLDDVIAGVFSGLISLALLRLASTLGLKIV